MSVSNSAHQQQSQLQNATDSDSSSLSLANLHVKPYAKDVSKLFPLLKSSPQGLSDRQAQSRLAQFGPNQLKKEQGISILALIWDQFNDLLVLILVLASLFSFVIGETIDAAAITAVIVLNGVLGFIQEYKAEQSMHQLKKFETPHSIVIRAGSKQEIEANQLVPGDVIIIAEGDQVPADARLLEVHSLRVDESLLTGESVPIAKRTAPLPEETGLADRNNMVFAGTIATKGRATALVIRTGMKTQMGQIATDILETEKESTPLQKALDKVGRILAILSLGVALPGLTLGILQNRDAVEMFMMAISLAVSAIPEGLPIVVTIALALGIKRMTKVNVLARKLATAESLGGTDVICTDKTGTITHNEMTVKQVYLPKIGMLTISGSGYETDGQVQVDQSLNEELGFAADSQYQTALKNLAQNSFLCSDATLEVGDPTERALVVLAEKVGIDTQQLTADYKRTDEVPFNSDDKYMIVSTNKVRENEGKKSKQIIIKGAPESVLALCQLSEKQKQEAIAVNDSLTQQSLRVLAIAQYHPEENEDADLGDIKQFHLIGLVGMYDPPRSEVKEALQVCHRAGIRVIMITGDHKQTAQAIADQIGLDSLSAYDGYDLDQMDQPYFEKVVKETNIFARVSPRHKVKILKTLQSFGHQVAMTGDGVNDASAIKKADVGIAVGSGTDLTKSVSDLILLDDNFASIAKGIKEGRRIFFNIKKFVRFMMSANFDEIAHILTSILLNLPLSLLPIHILWINLATDSLPALALTVDAADDDIMERKPYRPKNEIMKGMLSFSVSSAIIGYLSVYGLFLFCLRETGDVAYAQTISFTTTVLFELFLVFALRSRRPTDFKHFFSNGWLWLSVITAVALQALVLYLPITQHVLKVVPLSWQDWLLLVLPTSLSGLTLMELGKNIVAWAQRD